MSARAWSKVGNRLFFHRKRRLARRVMAASSFGVLIKARFRESYETPRKRAFRSSERLVRATKRDGQSYKHRNWDDCRSKVGRVRFRTVPRGPVRLGRLPPSPQYLEAGRYARAPFGGPVAMPEPLCDLKSASRCRKTCIGAKPRPKVTNTCRS